MKSTAYNSRYAQDASTRATPLWSRETLLTSFHATCDMLFETLVYWLPSFFFFSLKGDMVV